MSTLTPEQEAAISAYLAGRNIPVGLGTADAACSVAAINLALTGELTDNIPDCMSPVIGLWITRVQDAMPAAMRNGEAWRSLLPFAAGTGRDPEHERQRLAIIMDWMWGTVLPHLQPLADKRGFGGAWREMTKERTQKAARVAAAAAEMTAAAAEMTEARVAAAAAAEAAWAAEAARAAAWEVFDPPALLARLVEVGRGE